MIDLGCQDRSCPVAWTQQLMLYLHVAANHVDESDYDYVVTVRPDMSGPIAVRPGGPV